MLRENAYGNQLGHYALNVRPQQMSTDERAVRVARLNFPLALRILGQPLVLYQPRGEPGDGYFGATKLSGVEQDRNNPDFIWLELDAVRLFPQRVTLNDLYGAIQTKDHPFYTYSHSIRRMSDYEVDRLFGVDDAFGIRQFDETTGMQNPRVEAVNLAVLKRQRMEIRRKHALRAEMFRAYPARCSFDNSVHWSLCGRHCDTQVGHVVSLGYGGPDIIQNVLPMSPSTNWHWDYGLISLTNAGAIRIARTAGSSTRHRFEDGRIIAFADSRFWPKAEYLEWHRDNIFEKGPRPGLRWES